jgi:hypothetical protein
MIDGEIDRKTVKQKDRKTNRRIAEQLNLLKDR